MIEMLPPPEGLASKSDEGVRVLTAEEIKSVEPIFAETGNPLPDPAVSVFVGKVEGGKVVAFLVLQTKLHCEPMWIQNGRSELFQPVVKAAQELVLQRCGPQWAYLTAPAGRITQLALSLGFQIEPYVLMSKLIEPDTPANGLPSIHPLDETEVGGVIQ